MSVYVNVLLPIPLERLFTYSLGAHDASGIMPGTRLAVPFGRSKIYTGIAWSLQEEAPVAYEAKTIHQVLEETPVINQTQMRFWEWMAQYYMCTLGEVFRSAMPSAFLLESETYLLRNKSTVYDETSLPDEEFQILEALNSRDSISIDEIAEILGKKTVLPVVNRLIEKDLVQLKERLHERYRPRMVRYVRLGPVAGTEEQLSSVLDELSRAPKQREALLKLFQLQAQGGKQVSAAQLQAGGQVSAAVIKTLVGKGIIEEYHIREDRVAFHAPEGPRKAIQLNELQKDAFKSLLKNVEDKKVGVLDGVTSSGKTEVYFKLIEEVIAKGKQVLYMVPEIALTTQLISRLLTHFGEAITVYHSKYSVQERVEAWNNVLWERPKARIILGTRSALFLPFQSLGLIIVDEEHDASYKQFDPAPRYQGRDSAIYLSRKHDCGIVLGSATPSVETRFNVEQGKYSYTEIPERYGAVLMPDIRLVDLREAYRKKRMKGHFTQELIEAISLTLKQKEQVILFQNRRGFSPIITCRSCGHIPHCVNCDVSLTYHRRSNQLRCHYCGYHLPADPACQACGNYSLDTKGLGTEQVEGELEKYFPEARISRMDYDTTRGKHAYDRIISSFEKREVDIMVGTQMVTKGLDFRHVNLVGIMNADTLLNFPDYRAHERSFQMLTQVAGRAGRTRAQGQVLIQTFNPAHEILQLVLKGDQDGLYKKEIAERTQFQYPPVIRLIKITLRHKNYQLVNEASTWFADALRQIIPRGVLGPEFPAVARIRNQYIMNILVKYSREQSIRKIKNSISRIEHSFNAISNFKGVRIIYNVDYL